MEARVSTILPRTTGTVVVGGGIAGSSTAYHLAAAGAPVVLLERSTIGSGATSAAAGMLSPPLRQPFHETERTLGPEGARAIWDFALRSVRGLADVLEGAAGTAGLDLSGGHVLAEPWTEHVIRGSWQALDRAGLPVRWLSAAEARELVGGRGFTGGFTIEGGGGLDPAATTACLAEAARARGATVLEETAVVEVAPGGAGFTVLTDRGEIDAEQVVFASHVGTREFHPRLGAVIQPVRGQAFVTAPLPPRFRGAFATEWKLNVWRQRADGSVVVSGWRHGSLDHAAGREPSVDPSLQKDLTSWFESAFPDLAPLDIARRWSGTFGWTPDHLPLVGALPGRAGEWVVAGFSGGGLPFAFEAGRSVALQVIGEPPPSGAKLLDPARFAALRRGP